MSEELDPVFAAIRQRALSWQDPEAPQGSPSGVVMETGYPEGVVLLAAMSDGTVSLFFSKGGSVLGGGGHTGPAQAARALAMLAAQMAPQMPLAVEATLPKTGTVAVYVLIDGIVRSISGREKDFGENRSLYSPLFHAAHRVIAEIRRLPPPETPPAG